MLGQKRSADRAFGADNWAVVENAVKCVLTRQRSKMSFQYVYQCVFQLCQTKQGPKLALLLEELLDVHVASIIATIDTSSDDAFMETTSAQLAMYRNALEKLDSLMLFYNRKFALSCHKPTAQQLGESAMGKHLFGSEQFLARMHQQFCTRSQDEAFCGAMKAYSDEIALLEMGKWAKIGFEEPFLDALTKQYTFESSQQRVRLSVEAYLNWVDLVVETETGRVQGILNASFEDRVHEAVETVLVEGQREFLLKGPDGIDERLRAWNVVGLRTAMEALARVGEEVAVTEEVVQSVNKTVHAIFEKASSASTSAHPVERLVALVDNTNQIMSMMKTAINRTRVLRAVDESTNAYPELADMLSAYIDRAMRTSSGAALDHAVNCGITVFRVLRDKDVFEASYRNCLAARLMHASPEVIRAEKAFVGKLKDEGSASNVARLDGMLADVEASATVNQRIAQDIKDGAVALPIDFQIAVLTTAFWPTIPATPMRLPRAMETCRSFFTDHYLRRHNGRKLLFNLNTGSIAFSLRMPSAIYTVVAPTLYVHTILALNADADIVPDSLMALSSLPHSELASQFVMLEQAGLVVKDASGAYHFNTGFVSQRQRVKVSAAAPPVKVPSPAVDYSVRREGGVHDSRVNSLDAVIVKRLKQERTLHHNALCELAVDDLKHIFKPTVADIKGRLTSLIERGFISRSSADGYYIYCQ